MPRPQPSLQACRDGQGAYLHFLLVLGQPADVLLLFSVALLQHCPLILVEGNVLSCREGGADSEAALP